MRRRPLLLWLAGSVAFAGALAAAVAASGLITVAASDGHWWITEKVLHFAMRRSVDTHALGIDPPPLSDRDRILRGAGHYADGCQSCHGAPGIARSPVALSMTPQPPFLPARISHWEPGELFWIVKHGVKMTAMPAWPAQVRDDEVWDMVAFLLRLPDLDAAAYRDLALGPALEPAPESANAPTLPLSGALRTCARCHGYDGNGRGGDAFPLLAGQSEAYLYASLLAFASGERASGVMQTAAAALSPSEMRGLAAWFAGSEPVSRGGRAAPEVTLVGEGRRIATEGIPAQGVPACRTCHGPQADHRHLPIYPRLAGQVEGYLVGQLELLRGGVRGGTPYAHVMHAVATRLTAVQARAAAAYYASLPPADAIDGK